MWRKKVLRTAAPHRNKKMIHDMSEAHETTHKKNWILLVIIIAVSSLLFVRVCQHTCVYVCVVYIRLSVKRFFYCSCSSRCFVLNSSFLNYWTLLRERQKNTTKILYMRHERARELDRPNQTRNGWTTNWWYSCISQWSFASIYSFNTTHTHTLRYVDVCFHT